MYYSRYRPPSLREDCVEVIVDNILDVRFFQLKFIYHPLFSIEHVFAEKLRKLFEEYMSYDTKNKLQILKDNLLMFRSTKCNGEQTQNSYDSLDKKIKRARDLYFGEARKYQELIHSILTTWKRIKEVRETQSFSNTTVKLQINKISVNKEDNETFNTFFDDTVNELIHERNSEIKEKNHNNDKEDYSDSKTNENKSMDIVNYRRELEKLVRKIIGTPGETLIKLSLLETEAITKSLSERKEIQRRSDVKSRKMFFKLLCNGIDVCKSENYPLTDNFILDINEELSIQLTDNPKYLSVEIYEISKTFKNTQLCVMKLPIPSGNNSKTNREHKFENKEKYHFTHNGLGSGQEFKRSSQKFGIKLSKKENFDLKTKGILKYEFEWDRKQKIHSKKESIQENNLIKILDKNDVIDYEKINSIFETGEMINSTSWESLNKCLDNKKNRNYFR